MSNVSPVSHPASRNVLNSILRELTNIDLLALVNELKPNVVGKRFDKFYQYNDNEFFLKLKGDGQKTLLILLPYCFNFTNFTRDFKEPTAFAMTVRKYLENKQITGFEQLNMDRVIKLSSEDAALIIEFFGKGNLILVDKNSIIISALRNEETKIRKIGKGEAYSVLPSKKTSISQITAEYFVRAADKELSIIVNLSRLINFPALYFNEILKHQGLDPKKKTKEVTLKEIELIFKFASDFVKNAGKQSVIYEDKTYSGFDLQTKKVESNFATFSDLLDLLYSKYSKTAETEVSNVKLEKIIKKLNHQVEHGTSLEVEEREIKEIAELLLKKKELVEQLISAFAKFKKDKNKEELSKVLMKNKAVLKDRFIEIDLV